MNLSEVKLVQTFYERQLIFCYTHTATSAPYRVAHMLVVDTLNGSVSENTLGPMRGDRFSLEPLPSLPLCKQVAVA